MLKGFFFWRSWATEVIGSLVTKEQKCLQEKLLEAGNRLFSERKVVLIPCLFFLKGKGFVQSDPTADGVSCKIWLGEHN